MKTFEINEKSPKIKGNAQYITHISADLFRSPRVPNMVPNQRKT